MKKFLTLLCCCLLLTGCTTNDDSSSSDSTPSGSSHNGTYSKVDLNSLNPQGGGYSVYQNEIVLYTDEEVQNIIRECTDYAIPAEFFSSVPKSASHLSTFQKYYLNADSVYDFYYDFCELYKYLFPNDALNEQNLFYYGANSHITEESGHSSVKNFQDNFDEFLTENPEDVYYLFYSPYFQTDRPADDERNHFLESASPISTTLTNFNKGVLAEFFSEQNGTDNDRFLENYINVSLYAAYDANGTYVNGSFPSVDYAPNSEDSITLTDGKQIRICDAVEFYEDYINGLPCEYEDMVDIRVMRVYAIEVGNNGEKVLSFLASPAYEGIPFDYKPTGASVIGRGDESYEQMISKGYMAVTDDVDAAYGFGRGIDVEDKTDYTEFVSLEDAAKCCVESLSDYPQYELLSVELVYCAGEGKAAESPHRDMTYTVEPFYKFVVYNTGDAVEYAVYIDALTGEFERYYTAEGYKKD